jgi:outer membrane protein insertion porin family
VQAVAAGHTRAAALIIATVLLVVPHAAWSQTRPSSTSPRPRGLAAASPLAGRTVENVRVIGNTQVSTPVILNLVRTRVGEPFDPATVQEDYQRIFGLRKFANVEAKVEPTATGGVLVVFEVTEQRQIREVLIRGNLHLDELTIRNVIDLKAGEAIDRFRISLARRSIEELYRDKNFPFAHVEYDDDELARTGRLILHVIEGPNVVVRKVDFIGNNSVSADRLKEQLQTKSWIWIFRPGTYDPATLDDDVASLRRYYEQRGFFDARVGRKVIFSPDMTEVEINFVIEEGQRYVIDRVTFRGNASVSEADLRKNLNLLEGQYFDNDVLQRDVRQLVKTYSPFGFIYQQGSNDSEFLRITPQPVFRKEAGRVELVYNISEGKPFRTGRIIVKGNSKTQDKVILREMRVAPGQIYNSGEVQEAAERLRAVSGLFTSVNVTPIGDDPNVRDILVEVEEGRSASFNVGAGINSNGGIGGNVSYEQRNFDITNVPNSLDEWFSDRAFVGAGQTFRATFEPGTTLTNASLRFYDPWVFDQPYGFGAEAYLRNRIREDYTDRRWGGRLSLEKRFDLVHSARISLRGESVNIDDIEDEEVRAQEILDAEGYSVLTSIGLQLRRDTTNRGVVPYRGTTTTLGWESFGALGGDYTFQKFTAGFDYYRLLYEDLLDRRTVLALHADAGFIVNEAPFFERFYGGGIGSVRGFAFRGISPRSGPDDDRVGGDFTVTGSAEVNFPLYGETLRGVVFTDAGLVEREVTIGTIRTSVGAGIRLTLPLLGQVPIAVDVAVPITEDDDDDTQFLSFSLGFQQ